MVGTVLVSMYFVLNRPEIDYDQLAEENADQEEIEPIVNQNAGNEILPEDGPEPEPSLSEQNSHEN